MEGAVEFDDDVFFADLSKQLSLILDDDDESFPHYPSVNLQAYSRVFHPTAQASLQQPSRRESKGTGVFIPVSMNPRSKNIRQGKSTVPANKFQRAFDHHDYTRGLLPRGSNGNSIIPSQDQPSFNFRKF